MHTVVITHSTPTTSAAPPFARSRARSSPTAPSSCGGTRREDETAAEAAAPGPSTGHSVGRRPVAPRTGERLEEMRTHALIPRAPPTKRLDDADVITLAGREWVAVYTPGHTPDHLCLFDPAEGVLLSGDHVLPTITPHISGIGTVRDPLAAFFASLDRMHELAGVTHRAARSRPPLHRPRRPRQGIRRHHEERLERLRAASGQLGRPASVIDLSHHLFKPRAWGAMAESETFAHLEHLRLLGDAGRTRAARSSTRRAEPASPPRSRARSSRRPSTSRTRRRCRTCGSARPLPGSIATRNSTSASIGGRRSRRRDSSSSTADQ